MFAVRSRYNGIMKIDLEFKKRDLGQFFTTNADYILQGFEEFIGGKAISDPFAGNQELLNWCEKKWSEKRHWF